MYIYTHIHICTYIYIYIYTRLSLSLYIYTRNVYVLLYALIVIACMFALICYAVLLC